ncbi:hypothetical protein I541_5765 [Mycobacteroides abscessus]|nr:hypothetical protein I541_5765 [Mycobacteroides abscessus]
MSTHFDAVVVGAGQAGPSLARTLRGAGLTVAIRGTAPVRGTA